MRPFTITTAADHDSAIAMHANDPFAAFIAGGTDLIGLMKDLAGPVTRLLDINHLPRMASVERLCDGALRLGALARMSDVAADMHVRRTYPVLAEALLLSASGQLRNMASIGGNIMQRTRCAYFRDADGPPCNKRQPGSGCSALHGLNRDHAIFGWSDNCVAINPSDLAVALAALDATVRVRGLRGEYEIPIADFYRLPENTPERDTVLRRGELIVAVDIPASSESETSHYLKVRDRQSYEFAVVSCAVTLALDDGRIRSVRLAMGGVAHKPWRLTAAERTLEGVSLADDDRIKEAIATSFVDAKSLTHNSFKVELAQRAAFRALSTAAERT
jgi:xanthine dehydrogenase YagS FAD-binding subunit